MARRRSCEQDSGPRGRVRPFRAGRQKYCKSVAGCLKKERGRPTGAGRAVRESPSIY
ncbi:hypothetical protein FRUB_05180 [Fimbriiglobus ruber]|uniref:Uncharacterized protein n=1 Tax=Fimbriiglobus ruber TaxID=1908690 RepID=A0A225DFC3_9BACT|nr:hypothetical protein FRUB_05180 [Fimbriiglobus ruber]